MISQHGFWCSLYLTLRTRQRDACRLDVWLCPRQPLLPRGGGALFSKRSQDLPPCRRIPQIRLFDLTICIDIGVRISKHKEARRIIAVSLKWHVWSELHLVRFLLLADVRHGRS